MSIIKKYANLSKSISKHKNNKAIEFFFLNWTINFLLFNIKIQIWSKYFQLNKKGLWDSLVY